MNITAKSFTLVVWHHRVLGVLWACSHRGRICTFFVDCD
jgi:hypothetical protein